MHDVGKIGVPDAILLKPGPLDAGERVEMQRHAEIGYGILAGSGAELLDLAATIAWTHHERFDGGGYPRGLKGEEIPLEGRIAAVADVFDALTSDRVYRAAFTRAEALMMMRAERGLHFDPRVLDAFLEAEGEINTIMARTVPPAAVAE
jgi:putative two-component system response regulator